MSFLHDSIADSGVQEGDILDEKYRVEKVLGIGGMGIVVAARHIRLDERVAIKFLLPAALASAEAVARFEREARAAVKVKSEHVARVIDVGTLESGAPYLVMEYLEGSDLGAWLAQRGALPIEQAVEFILQACEAIAEAHALGIVHRDLKPANLFCVRRADGVLSVKVLDFGISKVTVPGPSGRDMGMTKTSAIMGSPLYMSPEQFEASRDVDARTDIWSMGVILYELITARPPFLGQTLPEVVLKIATGSPPPVRDLCPDAPIRLESVLLRCMERNRDKRFADVAALAVALLEFAPERAKTSVERIVRVIQGSGLPRSLQESPVTSLPGAPAANRGTVPAWGAGTAPPSKPQRNALVWPLALAVLAGGLSVALYLRPRAPHVAPPLSLSVAGSAPLQVDPPAGPSASAAADAGTDLAFSPVPQPSGVPEQGAQADKKGNAKGTHSKALDAGVKVASTASPPTPTPTPTPTQPAAHADCDPNFYFDAQGEKHFKPECFGVHPSSTHPR